MKQLIKILKTAKNVNCSEEAMEVVNEMEKKILEVVNIVLYGLLTNKFKLNDNFMNMANQFRSSDAINTINEAKVALKIDEERKIIYKTANNNEVFCFYFLVNLRKSTFSRGFGYIY